MSRGNGEGGGEGAGCRGEMGKVEVRVLDFKGKWGGWRIEVRVLEVKRTMERVEVKVEGVDCNL